MTGIISELTNMIELGQNATNKINELERKLVQVEIRLTNHENEKRVDEGWMTLSLAAQRCGLTQPALRQRIKNAKYPETIVWKQTDKNGAIFVNLKNLREYL
jgi:hypothetical protein